MDSQQLQEIDQHISDYLVAEAAVEPETVFLAGADVEDILEHGAFPPSDPRSPAGEALFAIARKLKDEGGNARLASALDAYRQQYGAKRAAILNVRWHYLAEQ